MTTPVISGVYQIRANGSVISGHGHFSYSLLTEKCEEEVQPDGKIYIKKTPTAPYIEGAVADTKELKVSKLINGRAESVTLLLANGKKLSGTGGTFTGDGKSDTGTGAIGVRWVFETLKEA